MYTDSKTLLQNDFSYGAYRKSANIQWLDKGSEAVLLKVLNFSWNSSLIYIIAKPF